MGVRPMPPMGTRTDVNGGWHLRPSLAVLRRWSAKLAIIGALTLVSGCADWEKDFKNLITSDDLLADSDTDDGAQVDFDVENAEPAPPPLLPKERPDKPTSDQVTAVEEPPLADPEQLIGLDERGVEMILGPPGTEREVPPAKIWQYSVIDCVISVYFYLNLESQAFQALRYEIVPRPGSPLEGRECYAQLEASRRTVQKNEG